jgi:ParB-like chromosome segregation protein Spo0J
MTNDRWQLLPPLSDDEYAALKADIGTQGVLVPIVFDADTGKVIEGHHRLRAWTELRAEGVKMPDYPKQMVRFRDDDERLGFVVAANLFRRHLTREQRADLVARLRAEGWSLRRIGDAVGVDHKTVIADLAEIGEIPQSQSPSVSIERAVVPTLHDARARPSSSNRTVTQPAP